MCWGILITSYLDGSTRKYRNVVGGKGKDILLLIHVWTDVHSVMCSVELNVSDLEFTIELQ